MTAGAAAAPPPADQGDVGVGASAAGLRSGPAVAQLYHRLLAATFLIAWASLGHQLDVLIGSRGLLPAAELLAAARARGAGIAELPTVLWLAADDATLHVGVWAGALLSVLALLGLWPRACIGASTALYLSYVTVGRTFFSFQWDNLLLECGALAVFLPTDRPAPWVHTLFRLLLFKLYWESGIAKWQSHLGDWHDGSAMMVYYETVPLPVWPAWYAHRLPAWWHQLESWLVLVIELVVPCLAFGGRRSRLACFTVLTAFQVVNLATANYGFFVYLSLALHAFLLGDRDVLPITRRLPVFRRPRPPRTPTAWPRVRRIGAVSVAAVIIAVSVIDALLVFAPLPRPWVMALAPLRSTLGTLRLINTYHLFGHITRERIEPEVQLEVNGTWQTYDFWHKPGAVDRAPGLVAPHQPRVDFQLWFYGLSFRRGLPQYVATLLDRLCHDPPAVQPLFTRPLPERPTAVRLAFWRYRFSEPGDDAWWRRELVATTQPLPCAVGGRRPPPP